MPVVHVSKTAAEKTKKSRSDVLAIAIRSPLLRGDMSQASDATTAKVSADSQQNKALQAVPENAAHLARHLIRFFAANLSLFYEQIRPDHAASLINA